MTSPELSKIILTEQINKEQDGDSTGAAKLKALWNELYEAKLSDTSNVDTWVKSNTGKLTNFGLDSNTEIDKILQKSDKEIYGKIPELQDKEYLDKLDKFSVAKLRSDARKNGFSSVQDYIQAAYKLKAEREFMKSFEPDPKADIIDKAREWTVKNFYPNAYEAAKNQPVYEDKIGDRKKEIERFAEEFPNTYEKYKNNPIFDAKNADRKKSKAEEWLAKQLPKTYGALSNQQIRDAFLTDQGINTVAIGAGGAGGGILRQLALGAGTALASEGAGKYFSNKDIDPLQIAIGAGLGAFGGRTLGKSGGDLLKGAASRLGITPKGDMAGKLIYGTADVFENAAIDPKPEVAMARKRAQKWLGPTNEEYWGKDVLNKNKAGYEELFQKAKESGKYSKEELDKLSQDVNRQIELLEPSKTRMELIEMNKDLLDKNKLELASFDNSKYPYNAYVAKSPKGYWRQSLKNELPTPENIKINKDIVEISDPKFNAFKSDLSLLDLDKPVIALEGQTGIPFRKAWAEPKFSSSLRTMLQGGSQLGARKSREMDDDDTVSIYNAILENKEQDVKRYNSGLDNNLTPYEKDIIQKFYIRK